MKNKVLILDIIIIIMLIGLIYYVWHEIEFVKIAGSDVCKLCEIKTGATCWKVQIP